MAALLLVGGDPPAQAQTATGYLLGTVVDESGDPAAGAAVSAYPLSSGAPQHTYADNDGSYALVLPVGEWKIEFETATRTRGLFVNEWFENQADRESADVVVIEAYEVTRGDATLTRNGRIWGTVSSVYEDALPDVCVELDWLGAVMTARTDADGMYEFTELKPGGYKLTFADCDPALNRVKPETLDTGIWLNWYSMQRQVDHRVTLQSVVSGRVVNTDGEPVPDMCAELGLTRELPASYYPYRIERTDADGRYVFDNLDHQTRYYWRIYDCNAGNRQYFPGPVHHVDFAAEGEHYDVPEETLLRYSSISGRVTDTQGNPISGIEVKARGSNWLAGRSTITASDGTYALTTLLPDSSGYALTFECYSLFCEYMEYQYPELITIPSDNTHITGIDAVLYQPGRIYGSIVNEEGSPLVGIAVFLYREGELGKRGYTDSWGNIRWYYGFDLEPGDYTIHFVDQGQCRIYDYWRGRCVEYEREPNTYQDHWYLRQRDRQSATALHLGDGETVRLEITMLPWGRHFTTPVSIDIKPGSADNAVNCRNEKAIIPVALFSTQEFDATAVDQTTIAFGPDAAGLLHSSAHPDDVDGDGLEDLLMHFRLGDTGLGCGTTEAVFTASTQGGEALEGIDSIGLFDPRGNRTASAPAG